MPLCAIPVPIAMAGSVVVFEIEIVHGLAQEGDEVVGDPLEHTGSRVPEPLIDPMRAAYLRGFPTRCAVANINAIVSMSLGWTLPGGIRIRVRSSNFSKRSTSAMESINPEETSGVFSSIDRLGLRTSWAMCSRICCASGVMRWSRGNGN